MNGIAHVKGVPLQILDVELGRSARDDHVQFLVVELLELQTRDEPLKPLPEGEGLVLEGLVGLLIAKESNKL